MLGPPDLNSVTVSGRDDSLLDAALWKSTSYCSLFR
jgi:hypothetical protein